MNTKVLLAIIALLTALVTNLDRAKDLWQTVFPKPPLTGTAPLGTTVNWTHRTSHEPNKLENFLYLDKVDATKVSANCTIYGDIHIWYQANSGHSRFKYSEIDWKNEEHPTTNFFYNDGNIIPIGWSRPHIFSYFEVVRPNDK